MTLSNPRALAHFFDTLKITDFEWSVKENRSIEGQGSGQILQAELAPDLWQATITIAIAKWDDARKVRAMLNSLAPIGRTALIYDPMAAYPASDPTGAILGGATVKLDTIGSNRDTIKLDDLPDGYVLTPGDKIEFQYGSNPVRRQLVEASESATAAAGGLTPEFAIYPHLRAGVTTSATVNLKKPALQMMRLSHNAGRSVPLFHDGMSISFIEKVI